MATAVAADDTLSVTWHHLRRPVCVVARRFVSSRANIGRKAQVLKSAANGLRESAGARPQLAAQRLIESQVDAGPGHG
jgi:hypothetical protein